MSIIEVDFPGNISQVNTAANLRALPSSFIPDNAIYLVSDLGLYTYQTDSMAADNGASVLKPDDLTPLQAGRWILSGSTLFQTISALSAPSGSSLVGFMQPDAGAGARSVEDELSDWIKPQQFFAVGDGVADDTTAITLADAFAKLLGKDLFLPAGTYLIDPMTATTNWYGEAGTILKNRGEQSTLACLVTATTDNIRFENLTFDGNVSADPPSWNSSNYDSFTGAAGLSIEECDGAQVINCRAQNTRRHGFRFVNCTNATWRGCSAQHARGNFGDCFIAISCIGLSISNCWAEDYTRIGFVVDSFGGSDILTTYRIAIANCFASNGHDASSLYGGGEFNAGFWCEHAGDLSIDGCFAWDNTHRGINIATGSSNNGFQGQEGGFTISNCHTYGSNYGIATYSLVGLTASFKVVNCSAKHATIAFFGGYNTSTDSFSWLNCHADYNAADPTGRGFAIETLSAVSGKPSFYVGPGCTISRWSEDMSLLNDDGQDATTADIGTGSVPASGFRLTVDGVRHIDDKPIYVRWFPGTTNTVELTNIDFNVKTGGGTSSGLTVRDATVRSLIAASGTPASAEIKDCTILGAVRIGAARADLTGCTVTISDTSQIWFLSGSASNYPALTVSNNRFEKNINTNGSVLRLGFGSASFQSIMIGNVFYNSGSASAGNPFLTYATGAVRQWASNYADNTVTNITDVDGGGAPETTVTGVTKIAMH